MTRPADASSEGDTGTASSRQDREFNEAFAMALPYGPCPHGARSAALIRWMFVGLC